MNAAVCVFVFNRNISGCNVIENVNAEASRRRNSLDWMPAFRSHFLRCGFGKFFFLVRSFPAFDNIALVSKRRSRVARNRFHIE